MNAPASPHSLMPQLSLREVPQALIDALQTRFGARCSTGQAVREQHGRDESALVAPPPAAVVFAESTSDVAAAVALAAQYRVPVRMISPLAVTTSSPSTLSRMVP